MSAVEIEENVLMDNVYVLLVMKDFDVNSKYNVLIDAVEEEHVNMEDVIVNQDLVEWIVQLIKSAKIVVIRRVYV
jgi:hypothetical protein